MGYKTIDEALPFLKGVDPDRQAQFREYFKTAPLWLMESFQIEEMEKNTVFIRENDPVDYIYFVGKGIIEAIEVFGGNPFTIGVQWHPEMMMGAKAGSGIFDAFVKACEKSQNV